MPQAADLKTDLPSATPDPDALAIWESLPRDEQVRRTRALLTSTEATTATSTTMADIWAEMQSEIDSRG